MKIETLFSAVMAVTLLGVSGKAQTYIFGRADFTVGNAPTAVAIADFNGDGINDVAVTNSNDNTVSILLGRPDASFAPQVTYPTGSEPVAMVVGDFNDDGNVDLAITNVSCQPSFPNPRVCGEGTISILLGNGDGTFQPRVDYPVGGLPTSVAAADFNGDGKLDLVVANVIGATVSVLLGNGDGTFQNQKVYPTAGATYWESVIVGDFNGDGKADLAVSGGVVSVLLGNGDGTFRPHIDAAAGGVGLAAGDLNGDGKLDLVVTVTTQFDMTPATTVLLGNGDGTFFVDATYVGGSAVALSDLNGDGKLDLLLLGSSTGVAVMMGNGDGTFQTALVYGTGEQPGGLAVADLNGDAKLDVAVVSGCNPQRLSACFTAQDNPNLPPPPLPALSVLLGFGDGSFVGQTSYAVGKGPLSITTADFNRDTNLDLATANQLDDTVSVLLGNGDGTFRPESSFSVGHEPVSVLAADLMGTGALDLITANETCPESLPCNPGTVSVLVGNGNGTFQPHVDYPAGLFPLAVALADFRGNGKLDLAVANTGSGTVSILLGNGNGTFQPQVAYPTAANPQQIAIGDFNGDDRLDLAVAAAGFVSILLGNGDGTFAPHVDYPADGHAVAVGDFNEDGKLDFVTADSNGILVFLGNGDGTFRSPVSYQTTLLPQSIAVGDFDLDGKLDIAESTLGGEAFLLLGNGDGTFRPAIDYRLGSQTLDGLTLGDFNKDGALDWAGPDSNLNSVYVMLSTAFKAISPSSLNFGFQGVGTTSDSETIKIGNPSNVRIGIVSISPSTDFSETNNCVGNLDPGGSCAVNVTFSPTAIGAMSGTITITDNTRISPLAISVKGSGVTGPFLSIHPGRQNFSPLLIGTSSNAAMLKLVNTGNAPLNITAVNIAGANSSDFSATNSCGSLSPAASCAVQVTFTPTAAGSRMAKVLVTDTAPGSPQSAVLEGTGVTLGLSIPPGVSASATVQAGGTADYKLSIGGQGVNGTVLLSCSGAPAGGECTVPASVSLSSTSTTTIKVSVNTTRRTLGSLRPAQPPSWSWVWALALMGSVLLPANGKVRQPARRLLWLLAVGFVLILCSCGGQSGPSATNNGGSSNPNGTPAGTYTLTVTARSGSATQSVLLTLIVQ